MDRRPSLPAFFIRRRPAMPDSSTTATATITVRLVYLARLREAFGRAGERVELPAGVATVGALRAWLAARGGAFGAELAPGRAVRIAVNHDVAGPDTALAADDEVALFPPVTGG
jgi:molybdopterin synthase sulfur carrier subunit